MTPLPKLAKLPTLPSTRMIDLSGLLPSGGGTGGIDLGGGTGGINLGGLPTGTGGNNSKLPTVSASGAGGTSTCGSFDVICMFENQMLRIVLLILGLLCVGGAIFLYKGTGKYVINVGIEHAKGAMKGLAADAVVAA